MMIGKRKLMVVDDEVEVCNFVRMFFEQRGFSVYVAYDGDESINVAKEQQPHVVLLDLNLKKPEDGFEVLPKLKQVIPDAKILIVTGIEDEASMLRGKALGADDYITKPLVLEYLESTVIKKIQASENPS